MPVYRLWLLLHKNLLQVLMIFFVDDYWLDCEDPENERRPEVSPISVTTKLWDDCSVLSVPVCYVDLCNTHSYGHGERDLPCCIALCSDIKIVFIRRYRVFPIAI